MPKRYTPEEIRFVKKNLHGRPYAEMTKLFNERFGRCITLKQMEALAYKRGLRNGVGCILRPGHTPYNKGKKLPPHGVNYSNYKPLGSERVERASHGKYIRYYVTVKTGPFKWEKKHKLIWEKAYGKVPKGHAVVFADGNAQNFDLDNLILVSRPGLAVMCKNRLFYKNKELTKIGKTIADVKLLIGERRDKKK